MIGLKSMWGKCVSAQPSALWETLRDRFFKIKRKRKATAILSGRFCMALQ